MAEKLRARRPYFRAEDTRRRICEAADPIFRRNGYSGTTVGEIASALGMTTANIYKHFDSKREIAEQVCARYLVEVGALMSKVAHSDLSPRQRLEGIFVTHWRFHREHGLQEPHMLELVLLTLENRWQPAIDFREMLQSVVGEIVSAAHPGGTTLMLTRAATTVAVLDCFRALQHPRMMMLVSPDQGESRIANVVEVLATALDL